MTGIKTLTKMYDDIVVAVGLMTAYDISHNLKWMLSAIQNEIREQFTWLELNQVVEYGLIDDYVRWVAQDEDSFVCKECHEKVHVVKECNHFGAICNRCCSHKNCTEIEKILLKAWNK
ncbi:MAG: hypothetical protein GPJ52_00070 [Candidatus Heimdallarchaeota archaeon]|nr:hypothetical protein [Candidatus Heimdallarchaeota archaeon]